MFADSCGHAELLSNKGLYYAMWRQQVGEGREQYAAQT
jgi:ATP-binding cassette, subfamily B, bacterial